MSISLKSTFIVVELVQFSGKVRVIDLYYYKSSFSWTKEIKLSCILNVIAQWDIINVCYSIVTCK